MAGKFSPVLAPKEGFLATARTRDFWFFIFFLETAPSSFARALGRVGEVEISDPVIRWRGEPDAALSVEEKFAHHGFGMRERIFDHFPGIRVEASNQILIRGRIPNPIVLAHNDRVRRCCRSRQLIFLECFRLWIKPSDLVCGAFSEPHYSVGID